MLPLHPGPAQKALTRACVQVRHRMVERGERPDPNVHAFWLPRALTVDLSWEWFSSTGHFPLDRDITMFGLPVHFLPHDNYGVSVFVRALRRGAGSCLKTRPTSRDPDPRRAPRGTWEGRNEIDHSS